MAKPSIWQLQRDAAEAWRLGSGRVSPERVAVDLQLVQLDVMSPMTVIEQIGRVQQELQRKMEYLRPFIRELCDFKQVAVATVVDVDTLFLAERNRQKSWEAYRAKIQLLLGRAPDSSESTFVDYAHHIHDQFEQVGRHLFDPFIFPMPDKLN